MKRNEEKVGNYFAYQVHAYTVFKLTTNLIQDFAVSKYTYFIIKIRHTTMVGSFLEPITNRSD